MNPMYREMTQVNHRLAMKTFLKPLLLTLVLSMALPGPASAEQLVREFKGDRSTETAEFEVDAPWLIDWRVNSEYVNSMGFDVELVNAPSGSHAGRVVKTKQRGDGLRLVDEGGRFRFKIVSALAYWTIKVIQLTPEEAEAYRPKDTPAY